MTNFTEKQIQGMLAELEAGGKEAYKAKLKTSEAAKKKAEEKALLVTDAD